MRSLVVEDEFASREKLKFLLEEHGECIAVENGAEALSAVKKSKVTLQPFDLICLDIKMPGKDGHEVLDALRKAEDRTKTMTSKRVKVFMTTGVVDASNISKAFYELADEYLTKPIDKESLAECLKKHSLIS